ncbi:uncharacterized protein LOC123430926 [Hordeum vulgare subsp. vulgare]|uniref:uncharacterized protein LOC123430926 n=1 Tax=Hordeum vulgare subsp. vulgare TaxID=112509 RepID=UPI001D1A3FE0|nr:uncharacterized protein LOC123430926 [Hordeum vulgare subsp. vulgare]
MVKTMGVAWGPALASTGEYVCCQQAKVPDSSVMYVTSLDKFKLLQSPVSQDEPHGDAGGPDLRQGSMHSLPPSPACPWSMARAGASGLLREGEGQRIQWGQCYTSSS